MRNVVENLANDSVRCVCDEFAGIRVEAGERGRRPGTEIICNMRTWSRKHWRTRMVDSAPAEGVVTDPRGDYTVLIVESDN